MRLKLHTVPWLNLNSIPWEGGEYALLLEPF